MPRYLLPFLLSLGCHSSPKDSGDSAADTDTDTDSDTDTDTDADADAETACSESSLAGTELCTSWIVNTTTVAPVIATEDAVATEDVQSVTVVDEGGVTYVHVLATAVPSYEVVLTDGDIAELTSRPKAATDFRDGAPLVAAGDTVRFGQDIGYDSTGCGGDEGYGYWPPGPECPEVTPQDVLIPAEVTAASTTCYTNGMLGIGVNGTVFSNWTDTFTYADEGTWHNLAPMLEVYDLDICGGHMNPSGYHHHSLPTCMDDELGDTGSEHSPVYAWAADGVPIYGPWYGDGVAAQSCWKTRDYDDATSETGCGGGGVRSCVLVDPLDPSLGTTPAESEGPNTSDVVTSLSGNTFQAVSGLYYEDWYFDAACAAEGGEHLDEHNGHDHDGLGYHYHVTSTFPFLAGPTFYGELDDNTLARCSISPYSDGPPPP